MVVAVAVAMAVTVAASAASAEVCTHGFEEGECSKGKLLIPARVMKRSRKFRAASIVEL